MTVALLAMSHSPLLEHGDPPARSRLRSRRPSTQPAAFVADFDPDLVVNFGPDHYNGFFYELMPPFCMGYEAVSIGDYGSQAGPLNVPDRHRRGPRPVRDRPRHRHRDLAQDGGRPRCRAAHGDHVRRHHRQARSCRSSSTPSPRLSRRSNASAQLGEAIGEYLKTLDKKVLLIGSGGLSHDPPVPPLATATEAQRAMLIGADGRQTAEARAARQQRVIDAADAFARGEADIKDLDPEWDQQLLKVLASGDLSRHRRVDPAGDDRHRRQLLARGPHLDRRLRGTGRHRPLHGQLQLLPAHPGIHRRLRRHHRNPRQLTIEL